MQDKDFFAAIGEKFIERFGGNSLEAAKFLKGESSTIFGKDSPFYTKVGPGSFLIARRGDSESDLLAKLYNLMTKEQDRLKKQRKAELKYQKQLVKIKNRRTDELIAAFGGEFKGKGVTVVAKKKGKLGLMTGLGVAGLLFSPDVMAMVEDVGESLDNMMNNMDKVGSDLRPTTEPTPTTGTGPKAPPELEPIFERVGRQVDIDPKLLKAVASAESDFKPTATSKKGARGLMGLMPGTAAQYGVPAGKIEDPEENIKAGAKYLKYLLGLFNNNLELALAAYNAGEGTVQRYGNKIPPFEETQKYVPKVLGRYRTSAPMTGQLSRPVQTGEITSHKGMRNGRQHEGIDIGVPVGTPVYAAHSGMAETKQDPGGYGTYVSIKSNDGRETRYAHLSKSQINSQIGQVPVKGGDLIGYSGGESGAPGAGHSTGPHLHFEVRQNNVPLDPEPLLAARPSIPQREYTSVAQSQRNTIVVNNNTNFIDDSIITNLDNGFSSLDLNALLQP